MLRRVDSRGQFRHSEHAEYRDASLVRRAWPTTIASVTIATPCSISRIHTPMARALNEDRQVAAVAPLPRPMLPARAWKQSFRRRLLAWYERHQRDLPWRKTSDPYAIWISEIMLQQTQVSMVIPYFQRF